MISRCTECSSKRLIHIYAECGDSCKVSTGKFQLLGQVPDDLNIGAGDTIEFTYCAECGQIQDDFPLDTTTLEVDGDEFDPND